MRQNSGHCPVSTNLGADMCFSALESSAYKFVYQMRMAAAVSGSLDKGHMVIVDDLVFQGKMRDFLGKQIIRIGYHNMLGVLKSGIYHRIFIDDLLPLKRFLCAVDIEALPVLADGIKKRT